jgi:signal transduction histidine kinase
LFVKSVAIAPFRRCVWNADETPAATTCQCRRLGAPHPGSRDPECHATPDRRARIPRRSAPRRAAGVATALQDARAGAETPMESSPKSLPTPDASLFEVVAAGSTRGVVVQRESGEVIWANASALRILGLPLDALRGREPPPPGWRVTDAFGRDLPADAQPGMAALRSGEPVRATVVGVDDPAATGLRWISVDAVPLFEPGAERPHLACTMFHDTTAQYWGEHQARLHGELLAAFSRNAGRDEYAEEVLAIVRAWTGCGCVGLRAGCAVSHVPWSASVGFAPQDGPACGPCQGGVFGSEVTVPVTTRDAVVGELHVADRAPGLLGAHAVRALETVGRLVGEALERYAVDEAITLAHRAERAISSLRALTLTDATAEELAGAAERLLQQPGLGVWSHAKVTLGSRVPEADDGIGIPVAAGGGRLATLRVYWRGSQMPRRSREFARAMAATLAAALQRRAAERQLAFADRLATMGTLAAGLAHEIRGPMSYVLANLREAQARLRAAQAAGAAIPDLDEVLDALEDAHHGASRASDVVRDLRLFSRRDDDDPDGRADVRAVLEAAVTVAAPELKRRAHVVREYGAVPEVAASASRLGQVFLNLLVNAAQALPAGTTPGNVRLRIGRDGDARVFVEVEDDGPGMTEAVRARLFEPFFTTKPADTGTGLGLSISRQLVREMGGDLEVRSAPGEGATFRVVLPAAPEAA